jgi:hypothetical protein
MLGHEKDQLSRLRVKRSDVSLVSGKSLDKELGRIWQKQQ